MTSIIEETDYDIVVIEDRDPELTCEFRYMDKSRCGRPAYVSAQLSKPCGHFNAGFLICKPHWEFLIAASGIVSLNCGRCGVAFDLKSCIVCWDIV